jgi:RHS repeat-associated protein
MTKVRTLCTYESRSHSRFAHLRQGWLPPVGSLLFAMGLIVALVPQPASPPGENVLIGPGGTRLHIERTSDDLTTFTPYTPGELWGGGNMVETCLPCQLEAASGKPAGQSIQGGQQVNPATGDFSYTDPLFSVPATAGTSLGLDLHYDTQEAEDLIGCLGGGGCDGVTHLWPDFGIGWSADQFPAEATWTDGSGVTWIQATEANGSLVTFQAIGSATTCPEGDNSNYENYTAPSYSDGTEEQNFCAPYRVNAQVGQFSSTYTVLFSDNGESTNTFYDPYGTPTAGGNVADQILLTYNTTLEAPGSGKCPTTTDTGTVEGCWTVKDATRTLTLVVGTPAFTTDEGDEDVLEVIDPLKAEKWVVSWDPDVFEEPLEFVKLGDSDVGEQFGWQGGTGVGEDDMVATVSLNPVSLAELINYSGSGAPEMVTSTTDQEQENTTTYSYADAATCGLCLGSGQSETTTVTYPDGEKDVDSYTEGILTSNTYGTGTNAQTVTYQINYPDPTDQDGPITETYAGPAMGESTTAQTNGVNITLLENAEGNYFTSMYIPVDQAVSPGTTFNELCWTAPGNESSDSCSGTPPSDATVYGYDNFGDVTSATDPYGNETRYGYDDDLMICWVAPPTITTGGSACGDPTAKPTEAPAGATAYQYDDQGDLNCQFVAYGEADETTTEADYDVDGEMTKYYPPDAFGYGAYTCNATIPNSGYSTSYTYTYGDLTKKTAPNDQVTTYTYMAGLLEEQEDPTGITTNAYDGDGRLCWTARASLTASVGSPWFYCGVVGVGGETSYTYLADTTTQATVTDPADNTTTYTYDDTAYPTSPTEIADPAGDSIVYDTYDANGNLCDSGTVATTDCQSQLGDTSYQYDTLGEDVTGLQDAVGNTTTYQYTDSAFPNLMTSETDALGTNTWTYQYDEDGRLDQSTDPSGNTVTTGYDADSRKCYQEVGNVTTYSCTSLPSGTGDSAWTYNLNGTMATMADNLGTPQAATTTYTYDAAGNQTSVTDDNGNTVNYAYNVSDQVTCIGYPGPTEIVTNCADTPSATNPIVKYGYDSENRLNSTTDWLTHETTYGYSSDGLNNLTSIDYPTSSADSVTYGYNADSQVNSQSYGGAIASVPNQSWGFNSDGLVDSATQLDAPGGTIGSYTSSPTYTSYLDRNWVETNTNPGVSGSDTYGYGLNGTLDSDTPPSGAPTYYGYNADNELCWSLDAVSSNSCLSPPTGATTYTSTPDGQRCWSVPSKVVDASCSTPPSSGATGYAWNAYGELCWIGPITTSSPSCGSPPSGVTTYTYDGDGDRMSETSSSGSTQDFTWNTSGSTPLLLQDGTNAYVYGPTLFGGTAPLEQINLTTGIASYLASAPSGVQLVLNQSGSIANESSYSTYGKQSNSAGAATPFGFSGAYTDPTGLVYLIHRYYDPSTGQFISVDPKVATTVQPYAYAGDDPLNATDPLGEESAGAAFLQWLNLQSQSTKTLFECAAQHGMQACLTFFDGGTQGAQSGGAQGAQFQIRQSSSKSAVCDFAGSTPPTSEQVGTCDTLYGRVGSPGVSQAVFDALRRIYDGADEVYDVVENSLEANEVNEEIAGSVEDAASNPEADEGFVVIALIVFV